MGQVIIFLHGLNDTSEYFKEFFEKINFKKKNSTKLIFMRVPNRDLSHKNMKQITALYDINWNLNNSPKSDIFEEVTKSRDIIKEIINKEAKLLNGNYSKIIIGGHYQGDCLSSYKGYIVDYGGVISLCGELFEQVNINENNNKLNENDKIIPFSYYKKTVKKIPNYEGISKDNYPEVNYFANNTFTQLASNLTNFLDRIL